MSQGGRSIIERKHRLDGSQVDFHCELIDYRPDHAIIVFRLPAGSSFLGLNLPPNSVSLGHFWSDRPYNAYQWLNPAGHTAAWYFNLSDHTEISPQLIAWRDLIVDVVVRTGQAPETLDMADIPTDLDSTLHSFIMAKHAELLTVLPSLITELEQHTPRLFALVNG